MKRYKVLNQSLEIVAGQPTAEELEILKEAVKIHLIKRHHERNAFGKPVLRQWPPVSSQSPDPWLPI